MSVVYALPTRLVLPFSPLSPAEAITKLVQDHFGDDYRYLTGTAIPPGQVNALFSKAHQLWRQYNSAETSYLDPKTAEWRQILIQPLVKEVLRSENPEDLAMLFGWVHTCRFAFGFQAGWQYSQPLTDLLRTISDKLRLSVGNDQKKTVALFELLNRHTSNDGKEIDYFGRGELCELLCKLYYSNPTVTLKDMTAFCSANITSLATYNGSGTENDMAYFITMKAKSVVEKANDEDKAAFITEYKKLSGYFTFFVLLGDIFGPWLEKLDPDNLSARLDIISTQVCKNALRGINILQQG
jgi:hypothetical protein